MSVSKDDVWEMWGLWHWRIGLYGNVYRTRREARDAAIGNYFLFDLSEYRKHVGKGKPYRLVKLDVTRAA